MITRRTTCRACGGRLDPLLSLGTLALPAFPAPGDPPPPRAPLDLDTCVDCDLVQLRHTVAPDQLYRQYWYRSAINESMRAELLDIVRAALLEVSVFPGEDVLDIGANDGYLLSCYPRLRASFKIRRIAYEPAANLLEALAPHAEVVVPEYFPLGAETILPAWVGDWYRRVKILTSVAMFYDVEDPIAFVRAVDACLHLEGVWILQFQDLAQMVDQTAFDNICHEHLTYWSLATFGRLLQRADVDLHVVHAERRLINGGSLRLVVRRRAYPVQATVDALLLYERLSIAWQALERFAWKVQGARTQIQAALAEAHDAGLTVDLYGASTKANTLLQYCGLDGIVLRQAWERNPEKYGRQTATRIPIVDEVIGRKDPPDLLLCGIYQFRTMILQREAAYLQAGGRILFPLPEVDIVGMAHAPHTAL